MAGTPGGVASNGPLIHVRHAGQTPSVEDASLIRSFELLQGFFTGKQLYCSFPVSDGKDVRESFLLHFYIKARAHRWPHY